MQRPVGSGKKKKKKRSKGGKERESESRIHSGSGERQALAGSTADQSGGAMVDTIGEARASGLLGTQEEDLSFKMASYSCTEAEGGEERMVWHIEDSKEEYGYAEAKEGEKKSREEGEPLAEEPTWPLTETFCVETRRLCAPH